MSYSQEMFNAALTSNGYPAPSSKVYDEFKKVTASFSNEERVMFLAQLMHESNGFRHIEERAYAGLSSHNEYRDDNSQPGKLYHGRGFFPLTWASNYLAASRDLGLGDLLLHQPELVAERQDLALKVSKWYWMKQVRPALREQPDCFGVTTKVISGAVECSPDGLHGRARRRYAIYQNAARAMGISHLARESGCYN